MTKHSPKLFYVPMLAVAIIVVAAFYTFAWTEPTQPPPQGNVAAPLRIGPGAAQVESTSSPTIWTNDTGGGNLLQLEENGSPRFRVATSGSAWGPGSITFPIFYDYDNTDWRVNPSGFSYIATTTIGATTMYPGYRLNVNGNSWIQGALGVKAGAPTSTLWVAGGKVGIGTTGPGDLLHIHNVSGHAYARLETASGNQAGLKFIDSGSTPGNWIIGLHGGDDNKFKISQSTVFGTNDRLTILESGNVGIGTTTPSATLDVGGGIMDYIDGIDDILVKGDLEVNGTIYGDITIPTTSDIWVHRAGDTMTGGLGIGYPQPTSTSLYVKDYFYVGTTTAGTTPYYAGGASFVVDGSALINGELNMNNNNIGAVNKISVSVIDPVYEFNGKKYATYVSDFAGGLRNVTAGKVYLDNSHLDNSHQYIIDFDKLQESTNLSLWLFWQSSNKNIGDLVVQLTPGFNGRAWARTEANRVIINGTKSGIVFYTFIIPRHDAAHWPTLLRRD